MKHNSAKTKYNRYYSILRELAYLEKFIGCVRGYQKKVMKERREALKRELWGNFDYYRPCALVSFLEHDTLNRYDNARWLWDKEIEYRLYLKAKEAFQKPQIDEIPF